MSYFTRGKFAFIAITICLLLPMQAHRSSALAAANPPAPASELTMTVRSSSNALMYSKLDIVNAKIIKSIIKAKKEATEEASLFADIEVQFTNGHQTTHYRLDRSGRLWETASSRLLVLPSEVTNSLLHYGEIVRQSHYGKLMRWEEAERIVGRKNIFSITELESGLTFRVQRRAGSSHADVQPISKEDSKIMKRIYEGKWSWKRKAVLVQSGRIRIAASMNGMPHGGDGIPDNGFSGHFCVHFQDSTSHKSKTPDPAHQLMVHKAAGELKRYFESATPDLLAESFVEAMYQKDKDMLTLMAEDVESERLSYFIAKIDSLESIRIDRPTGKKRITPKFSETDLAAEMKLPIKFHVKGHPDRATTYTFQFKRETPQQPWRIVDVIAKSKK